MVQFLYLGMLSRWNFLLAKAWPLKFTMINFAGMAVGMKNWLRITFAIEPSALEEGLGRIKAFCQRHAKQQ